MSENNAATENSGSSAGTNGTNRRPGSFRHRNGGSKPKLKGKLEGVYTLAAKSEPVKGYGFSEFEIRLPIRAHPH